MEGEAWIFLIWGDGSIVGDFKMLRCGDGEVGFLRLRVWCLV